MIPSDNFPKLDAKVHLTDTKTCLTLTYKDQVGEFFTDPDGQVNLWELDDWISKLIADVAEKQNIRNRLSGK